MLGYGILSLLPYCLNLLEPSPNLQAIINYQLTITNYQLPIPLI